MITEADVKAKPDDELLDIWARQHEYVQEMIPWVRAEIDRRHLDTSHIHVRTPHEIEAAEQFSSDRQFLRIMSVPMAALGLALLVPSVVSIIGYMGNAAQGEKGFNVLATDLQVCFGTLSIVWAVGVYREKWWAIVSGLILYSVITLWNAADAVMIVCTSLRGHEIDARSWPLLLVFVAWPLGRTAFCACIVLAFNRLRWRSIKVKCPSCGSHLQRVTVDMIGETGICPKCHAEFEIADKRQG